MEIVDKITGHNTTVRFNMSHYLWSKDIVQRSWGNIHRLQRILHAHLVESARAVPEERLLYQPDLNVSYQKDFHRLFQDKELFRCAQRLFATIHVADEPLFVQKLFEIAKDGMECDQDTMSHILLNKMIHFLEIADVDKRNGFHDHFREERIWFDDEYFVHWLFDPDRASEEYFVRGQLGHILISKFYMRQSGLLFSKYIVEKLRNFTKTAPESMCCLPTDTLICMPSFCFRRLLYHVMESNDLILQNDFEKGIIQPLMRQNRTRETLTHVARMINSYKIMNIVMRMLWSSVNHGMLEDAACHAVLSGNVDSLQAIINKGIHVEGTRRKIDKTLSGMNAKRCGSINEKCNCHRYKGKAVYSLLPLL